MPLPQTASGGYVPHSRWGAREWVLALAVVALAVGGWYSFAFLTDDAFIAFRYVSNAMAGRGLVWNPEPFPPVEGYTSFAWVLVLWFVWAVFGVEPPAAANVLSLFLGLGTLAVGWRVLSWMPLSAPLERHRGTLRALVLLSVVANRVFVTWLSSGLETALFVFATTWWIAAALGAIGGAGTRRVTILSAAATLMTLTRPDGLLAVAATLGLFWFEPSRRRSWRGMWPLLAIAAHVAWRRSFYGEWLPNTYYAKVVAPWPEAGVRYAYCFAIENGTWMWLALAAIWAGARLRGVLRGERRVERPAPRRHFGAFAVVAVLAGHAAYYTLLVGGDHFEFRVFAHLPLPMMLGAAGMAAATWRRPRPVLLTVALVGAATLPLAWLQWARGGPLGPLVPSLLRPLLASHDACSTWLHERYIAFRQPMMKETLEALGRRFGERSIGARISWDDRPVIVGGAVGMLGWVLPNVAVLDTFGLNDWVVARAAPAASSGRGAGLLAVFDRLDGDHDGRLTAPELDAALAGPLPEGAARVRANAELLAQFDPDGNGVVERATLAKQGKAYDNRYMAHERAPPPGYFEGFRPNVRFEGSRPVVEPRTPPLLDADIRAHEALFRARVRGEMRR